MTEHVYADHRRGSHESPGHSQVRGSGRDVSLVSVHQDEAVGPATKDRPQHLCRHQVNRAGISDGDDNGFIRHTGHYRENQREL